MKKSILVTLAVLGVLLPMSAAMGQQIGGSTSPAQAVKRIAVLPILFFEDDNKSDNEEVTSAFQTGLDTIITKLAIDKVDTPHVLQSWKATTGSSFSDSIYQMPDAKSLLQVGHNLGTDYVLFARVKWHARSVWQGLGPKTHANATVDLWIINVKENKFELRAENIVGGSTEHEPAWKSAVTLLVLPVSVVSGGPKTPHMKHAGVVALDKAIGPWVERMSAGEKIK